MTSNVTGNPRTKPSAAMDQDGQNQWLQQQLEAAAKCQNKGVEVNYGTPINSDSSDTRHLKVSNVALSGNDDASLSDGDPQDLDGDQLATSRMEIGDDSLLTWWDKMDTPGRLNQAAVEARGASSASIVLVLKWQGEFMHPESWCMRHQAGDRRGLLTQQEFTVFCFLDFYKMITEDDMFENLDLTEQCVMQRRLISKYLSFAGDERRDAGLVKWLFDST